MPRLFRRRTVWMPTLLGLLVVLAVSLALVAALAVAGGRWIGGFLAPSAAAVGADGRGARILVVEGWLGEPSLDAAIATARRHGYERVLVSGGPIDDWPDDRRFASYAERAADYLKRRGLTDATVVAVPAPATDHDRTYLSATTVRDWLDSNASSTAALDLFTLGVHARRTRAVYRLAFGPRVEIGVLAARPADWDVDHWWRTSGGVKAVLAEAIGLAWTTCCFWPPPQADRRP